MGGSINPFQLIQLIKSGNNPQQLVMGYLRNQSGGNNPILNNAMNMAQGGNVSGLEQLARNLAKQRGIDFDDAFNNFKSQLFNN